ncbi:cupin-like domain-containing protein [Yeosuana marina]|uniref:cupin-like domain-containing protein n=1 Tax=Yeosuana marina TaxID=1565536 RepID=UPI0030C8CCE2
MKKNESIEYVNSITPEEFHNCYVKNGKPVVIQGMMDNWKALSWDNEYLKTMAKDISLAIKQGDVSNGNLKSIALKDYLDSITKIEFTNSKQKSKIGYLHDTPLFSYIPKLVEDVTPFPKEFIPNWYWSNWANYVQFFIGPKDSITPLHFDTLGTHNLFFQISGKKEFTLIPPEQRKFCYMNSWRWSKFDPSNPDFDTYPLARKTTPTSVIIQSGDILYIPSYTLHHVRSLSNSISFNIDWHTSSSARKGIWSMFKGAPYKNAYYNLMLYLGLGIGVPEPTIYPRLKSYMSYVS